MWIKCKIEAVESLYVEDVMDGPVEFNDNGKANVKKSVGEALIDRRSSIMPTSDDEDDSDDGSGDLVEETTKEDDINYA